MVNAEYDSSSPQECSKCGFVYHVGDAYDEKMHEKHHRAAQGDIKFTGEGKMWGPKVFHDKLTDLRIFVVRLVHHISLCTFT